MTEINLEQLRENILLIQKSIEIHDSVTEAIVDNRIKYEALKRMPHLGNTRNGVTTPAEIKSAIDNLRIQQVEHADIVKSLTQTESVDAARQVYLDLITAFQRVGQLRELERLVIAGYPAAIKEAIESFALDASFTQEDIAVVVYKQMEQALDHLGAVSAVEVPEISEIVLPGIRLAQ